jgi:hypothetical protein
VVPVGSFSSRQVEYMGKGVLIEQAVEQATVVKMEAPFNRKVLWMGWLFKWIPR